MKWNVSDCKFYNILKERLDEEYGSMTKNWEERKVWSLFWQWICAISGNLNTELKRQQANCQSACLSEKDFCFSHKYTFGDIDSL